MSIVGVIFNQDRRVVIVADKRVTNIHNNGSQSYSDNDTKVIKITETIACGIVGSKEYGMAIFNGLRERSLLKPSELIKFIESVKYDPDEKVPSSVILCGVYDDRRLFLYVWSTVEGSNPIFIQDGIKSFISASTKEVADQSYPFLTDRLKEFGNAEMALKVMVHFASTLSHYISANVDIYTITALKQ